MGRIIILPR